MDVPEEIDSLLSELDVLAGKPKRRTVTTFYDGVVDGYDCVSVLGGYDEVEVLHKIRDAGYPEASIDPVCYRQIRVCKHAKEE